MNIDTALEKIYSLKQFHVKLGLDNIRNLLDYLGNPQENLRAIHVAGSNGKGSTCSFLASILQEYNYKVGLYTSPHFVKFNERIRINGEEISDEEIIKFLEKHKKYIDKYKPTFFEITTALAFKYFSDNKVDFAVIETGLGGRLDATNVLIPLASVITSISLEHSHILGNSLSKIAFEKGGIIKEGIPVFIGDLPIEAKMKIKSLADDRAAELIEVSKFLNLEQKTLKLNNVILQIFETGLRGVHQVKNAALAVLTIARILKITNKKIIQKGLDKVVENSGLQGRYEILKENKNVIFDAAHNLEGIEIFIHEFKKGYQTSKNRTLIFGAMRDKEIGEMLKLLAPLFDNICVTSTDYDRAATAEEIKEIATLNNINVQIISERSSIAEMIKSTNRNQCLVILGSIYLLGEIKKFISIQN